jgi:hypothetical protein
MDQIVEAVRAKLLARSQAGMLKYGVTLDRKDLSRLDWLNHAQQEALDLANYLEVMIQNEFAGMNDKLCDNVETNLPFEVDNGR